MNFQFQWKQGQLLYVDAVCAAAAWLVMPPESSAVSCMCDAANALCLPFAHGVNVATSCLLLSSHTGTDGWYLRTFHCSS